MADDYTPTDEDMRTAWIQSHQEPTWGGQSDIGGRPKERIAEFDRWLAAHDAEVRAGVVPEEPEWGWQWCYVEKWADDSGVYERVTFDTLKKARRYLRDNAERLAALNAEATEDDRVVASIEKRRVTEPGPWLPVEQEGENR